VIRNLVLYIRDARPFSVKGPSYLLQASTPFYILVRYGLPYMGGGAYLGGNINQVFIQN
jgi:hypothetical protein